MQPARLLAAAGVALALAMPASGAVESTLSGPREALRVDGWGVSAPVLQLLLRVVRLREPGAGLADVASGVVQDRLLGTHAAHEVGDAELFEATRVTQPLPAWADAALAATIEAGFGAALQPALAPQRLQGLVVRRHDVSAAQLRRLLGQRDTLRLDDRLDAGRERRLRDVTLLEYRFDGGPLQRLSLLDTWQALDVHGRNALFSGDAGFAMQQAARLLRQRTARHWAVTEGGLTVADMAVLQQLVADHERRRTLAQRMGAGGDPHAGSPQLEQLKAAVSAEDMAHYYATHRDRFKRVDRVQARHIRCPDEACATAARDALAGGEDFGAVARRLSVAPTRDAGGDLGWLDIADARSRWIAQLAFAQPPGPPTAPIREPAAAGQTAGWDIVQVSQRVMGYHEADSEAVRFAAREALARERAAAGLAALNDRLVAAASIELNAALLGFGPEALKLHAAWPPGDEHGAEGHR